jgi:hypothetical protein
VMSHKNSKNTPCGCPDRVTLARSGTGAYSHMLRRQQQRATSSRAALALGEALCTGDAPRLNNAAELLELLLSSDEVLLTKGCHSEHL